MPHQPGLVASRISGDECERTLFFLDFDEVEEYSFGHTQTLTFFGEVKLNVSLVILDFVCEDSIQFLNVVLNPFFPDVFCTGAKRHGPQECIYIVFV